MDVAAGSSVYSTALSQVIEASPHTSHLQVLLRGLEGVVNSMGQTVALPVLHGMNATDPACQLLAAVQANVVISAGESMTTSALKPLSSLSKSGWPTSLS